MLTASAESASARVERIIFSVVVVGDYRLATQYCCFGRMQANFARLQSSRDRTKMRDLLLDFGKECVWQLGPSWKRMKVRERGKDRGDFDLEVADMYLVVVR